MTGHFADTRRLINDGTISDTFAKHFASHFKMNENKEKKKKNDLVSIGQIRKLAKVSILWQGKPISNMKTFGKLNCSLCMRERLSIIKALKRDKNLKTKDVINSNNEIYGACRHKPKFHRYARLQTASTDEGLKSPERSDKEILFSSPNYSYSPESDQISKHLCVPCSPLVEKNKPLLVVDL